ncbi:MAG TPA: cob(I)yrinic acid a,c-diamide adenosyltransferase [Anaerolineales bacterium]
MSPFRNNTGDDGKTGLLGDYRLPKYHPRIETLGDLDEASAALGLARSLCRASQLDRLLVEIQRDLYTIMTEIATTPENTQHFKTLDRSRIDWLESESETILASVSLPAGFILSGDSPSGAALDMARTIVRRSERRVADLIDQGEIKNRILLQYLNRLSSLCFALELLENKYNGHETTLAKK